MRAEKHFEPNPHPAGTYGLATHLTLLEYSRELHKSKLKRRDVPVGPSSDAPEWLISEAMPNIAEGMEAARGWSYLATLAQMAADVGERDGLSRAHAVQIASRIFIATLPDTWLSISATSLLTGTNSRSQEHVLLAEITTDRIPEDRLPSLQVSRSEPRFRPFVYDAGTLPQLAAKYGAYAASIVTIDLSEAARILRSRARKHKIKLQNFWAEDL